MTARTSTPTPTPAARVDLDKDSDTVRGRFAFTLPTVTLPDVMTLPNVTFPALSLDDVRRPAYAFAGLADLAIEQVKDVPATYAAEISAELKKVSERLAEVPTAVRTLPAQVKELRGEVESRVATAQESATDLYAQLAVRGERLVTAIRRSPATEAAIAEGKEAVQKAEQATIAARKSARAGGKAVEDAASKIG